MKKHTAIYAFFVILCIWGFASIIETRGIIPSPIKTLFFFTSHIVIILRHLTRSLMRILTAIFTTMILGSLIGILTARNQSVDSLLTPVLYALYPVPKIAFLPILMLFFGLGDLSKIILVGLILFFQIAITVRDGLKSIPEGYFLTLKIFKPSPIEVYRHIIFPALLPQLFTALRISVGTSISVLFFAENYATQYGIGYFIMDSWLKLNYTAMFSGIVAISLMGSLIFFIIDLLERHFCKWREI